MLSVCGDRLDLGFSIGPSFRPERARLSEELIFDLSRGFFEVRRFFAGKRAESRNPGFCEFLRTGRGGMLGPRTFGKQAFLSRQGAAACGSEIFGAVCRRAAGT